MTLQHWYDGSQVTSYVRLEDETSGYAARAEIGEADVVRVIVDDEDSSLDFVGYKVWLMKETACATGSQVVWRGYVGRQRISRAPDDASSGSRRWELDLIEDNGRLRRKLLRTSSADRPAETVNARLAWLLAEPTIQNTAHAFADHGLVESSTVALDAADYNGRFPVDVLADCALASGYNYYIRWNETEGENELVFQDTESSTADPAALTISNDPGDLDYATIWPPVGAAVLDRDPSRLVSGIWLPYGNGGTLYSVNSATASTYGSVEQVAPTSSVKTATAAAALATRLLASHAEQDESLEVDLVLPAAKLNDIRHGQYISRVYIDHLPTFRGRPARVVTKSFARPANLSQDHYVVRLRATPAPSAPVDPLVQSMSWRAEAYGQGSTFGLVPTPGNLLVVTVARRDGGTAGMDATINKFRVNDVNGRTISFTAFGAPTYATVEGSASGDPVAIAYVTAVGDEQTIWLERSDSSVTVYELTGVTAAGAEIQYLSDQAASATKTLPAWSVPGVIQIARFVVDTNDGASDAAVAGSGWTIDHSGRYTYYNGVWHPLTPSLRATVGTAASISGSTQAWGGIAVALVAS